MAVSSRGPAIRASPHDPADTVTAIDAASGKQLHSPLPPSAQAFPPAAVSMKNGSHPAPPSPTKMLSLLYAQTPNGAAVWPNCTWTLNAPGGPSAHVTVTVIRTVGVHPVRSAYPDHR